MKILLIGDIFGECGLEYLKYNLKNFAKDNDIDVIIANAENVSGGNVISYPDYDALIDMGVDVITMGNHTFGRKDIFKIFENENNIIRPINYPDVTSGKGSVVINRLGKRIGVINAMGRVNILNIDCPFKACEKEIENLKEKTDIIIVDFHADATSEKRAFGCFLDGKVTCVFGTHTHVQTADEEILPRGTAYISDIGMTGAVNSVLGIKTELIIDRFIYAMPQKFEQADGKAKMCGAILTIDEDTNKAVKIERVNERE